MDEEPNHLRCLQPAHHRCSRRRRRRAVHARLKQFLVDQRASTTDLGAKALDLGGARWHFSLPRVELRLAPLLLLALLLQIVAIWAPLGSDDLPRRILFLASYTGILAFVAANLRRPGLVILGIGAFLNFLPIVANGGLMPVTPETLLKTGEIPADARVGEWVPGTKDVLKEREDVQLYFLSDRLTSDLSPFRAFSIGDLIIVAGALFLTAELLLPRPHRVST